MRSHPTILFFLISVFVLLPSVCWAWTAENGFDSTIVLGVYYVCSSGENDSDTPWGRSDKYPMYSLSFLNSLGIRAVTGMGNGDTVYVIGDPIANSDQINWTVSQNNIIGISKGGDSPTFSGAGLQWSILANGTNQTIQGLKFINNGCVYASLYTYWQEGITVKDCWFDGSDTNFINYHQRSQLWMNIAEIGPVDFVGNISNNVFSNSNVPCIDFYSQVQENCLGSFSVSNNTFINDSCAMQLSPSWFAQQIDVSCTDNIFACDTLVVLQSCDYLSALNGGSFYAWNCDTMGVLYNTPRTQIAGVDATYSISFVDCFEDNIEWVDGYTDTTALAGWDGSSFDLAATGSLGGGPVGIFGGYQATAVVTPALRRRVPQFPWSVIFGGAF